MWQARVIVAGLNLQAVRARPPLEYVVIFGGQQHFSRKLTSHFVEFRYQGLTSARAETYHDRL